MVYSWMINSTRTVTFMDDKNICHRIDLNFIAKSYGATSGPAAMWASNEGHPGVPALSQASQAGGLACPAGFRQVGFIPPHQLWRHRAVSCPIDQANTLLMEPTCFQGQLGLSLESSLSGASSVAQLDLWPSKFHSWMKGRSLSTKP